jgi:hypothetical protein
MNDSQFWSKPAETILFVNEAALTGKTCRGVDEGGFLPAHPPRKTIGAGPTDPTFAKH